jgi:Tfp pilus assembly protein PilE
MFGFSLPSWLMPVVVVGIIGLALIKAYSMGVSTTKTKYELKISQIELQLEKEYNKQIDDLLEKNRQAKEIQDKLSQELSVKENTIEQLMLENQNEAASDPNAKTNGISESSTKRLNKLR